MAARAVDKIQKANQQNKIADTAEKILIEKGYDQTSLNDVIKKSGIAKGTFYYYFNSKDSLLDFISARMMNTIMKRIKKVVDRDDLDAISKFNLMIDQSKKFKIANRKMYRVFTRWLYSDTNIRLRHKLMKNSLTYTVPEMTKIIEQGKNERSFVVKDAHETSEIILSLAIGMAEAMGPLLVQGKVTRDTVDLFERKAIAYNEAIEKLLGVKPGKLKMYEKSVLKEIFKLSMS